MWDILSACCRKSAVFLSDSAIFYTIYDRISIFRIFSVLQLLIYFIINFIIGFFTPLLILRRTTLRLLRHNLRLWIISIINRIPRHPLSGFHRCVRFYLRLLKFHRIRRLYAQISNRCGLCRYTRHTDHQRCRQQNTDHFLFPPIVVPGISFTGTFTLILLYFLCHLYSNS